MTTESSEGLPVAPTHDDPVVRALSESVGGPLGRHAGRHPWWTPARVLLALTAIVFALGLVQKTTCFSQSWGNGQTRYTHMCYSDLPYLYTGRGFSELQWPYDDDPVIRTKYEAMEYPVGISYWAWGTAWVTHWLAGSPDISVRELTAVDDLWGLKGMVREVRLFVSVNAVGFGLLALLSTWLLTRVNRRRPWDAAAFALSPALLLTGIINWDMLAVATVAAALWAWARGRPLLTGIFIGIGTATKLYPLFLLGGLIVICWRQRRLSDAVGAAAAGFLAWVVVDVPAMLTGPDTWKVFWRFNADRGTDWGSLWLMASQMTQKTISPHTINQWSWALFAAWCVGVLIIGLKAPRTPRLAQLGFLIVAGFLLVNKVYSPQYVLWLLPLAVLARPRWRDQLIWQACEVVYFAGIWWELGGLFKAGGGSQDPFYWITIIVRVLGELYLVGVVVRDLLLPERDPVERPEELDDEEEVEPAFAIRS